VTPAHRAERRSRLKAATWLTCLGLLANAGIGDCADGVAPAPPEITDEEAARAYFSDLPLRTQDGREVRFFSDVLQGRVVVLSSFYTGCHGVSPRQGQVLSQLQDLLGDRLGKDVSIVSITVDPENDTVEKVSEYAEQFKPRPGWVFLTGKPENVDWINYKLGQRVENLEEHAGIYMLGNVTTALWMKVPFHAMASDLYFQVQKLLEDRRELYAAVPFSIQTDQLTIAQVTETIIQHYRQRCSAQT